MLRSIALLTTLTLAWGMNWSVMKIGATQLPPLWFRSIGIVLGTLLLGLVLVLRGTSLRLPRGSFGRIVFLSFPNIIVWFSVVTIAVTLMPVGRAAILGYTMPVWSALLGVCLYREPLDRRTVVGVAAAAAAIALLLSGDWTLLRSSPAGVGLMLLSAVSWAWGTHLIKRSPLALDTLALTFWMMLVACPVMLAASAWWEGDAWRVPHGGEWLPIAYNAVLVLALGNIIWFTIARTVSPTLAGLSTMAIPIVGVFSGVAMLGETPTATDLAALVLIVVAVAASLSRRPLQS